MTYRPTFRLTFAAALVAAAIPASNALAQQSASCQELIAMADRAGEGTLLEEFRDIRAVATADDAAACELYVARVVEVDGVIVATDGENATAQGETEEVTETLEIERTATIEGEVEVTLPDPRVEVEQDPAEIAVRTPPPEVSVSQGQPTITVRQAQPIITVRMTQPTITVEQPAPEIVVTMPEPGVDVATMQPIVEVNIPEPRVTVTQGQPRLDVDLDTEVGAVADSNTRMERAEDADGNMVVTANGLSSGGMEPRIEYVQSEEAPMISVQGAEPDVEYVAAEADVRIESDGEPVVEMVDSGEPKIMIRQAGEDEGAALETEETTAVAALAPSESEGGAMSEGQRDPREAFAVAENPELEGGTSGVMTVGDLSGMDVRNARGEELGEVDRVVRNGNATYVIVEHGGWFFGLNDKEIALPIDDVTMRGEEIVLRGLTEEQIESMPDYDYDSEVALGTDDEVTLRRIN